MAPNFGLGAGAAPDAEQQGSGGPPADGKPPRGPKKETKTLSRKITGSIAQCSAKMTEILSWQSKLAENKNGLNLELMNE